MVVVRWCVLLRGACHVLLDHPDGRCYIAALDRVEDRCMPIRRHHRRRRSRLEDRCTGMASKFTGQTDKLYADGADTPQYVSTVSSKLHQDPSIDAVITLGPALGVAVQKQLEQDGSKAQVGTYAFTSDLIPLLQNGKIAFTIDQQPYLQGYLSVDSLWLYHRNHAVIGAQQSVATGPAIVDKSNFGDLTQFISDGLR
jgi:simple sugar transport system substrate-binding protein